MAKFWSKPPEPSPALSGALADLDRLARLRPELESAARSLGPVLVAAFLEPVAEFVLPAFEAFDPDRSIFEQMKLPVDLDDLATRLKAIAKALRTTNPAAPTLADTLIEKSFTEQSIGRHVHSRTKRLNKSLLAEFAWVSVSRGLEDVAEMAQNFGLDPDLTVSMVRIGLLPQLSAWSEKFRKSMEQLAWKRGDCPHCGSAPLFAETRGLEAKRFLRCGLCAADWAFERLRCPACDVTDHRKLANRYVEGEGDRFKIALCEACGYRIKVVSSLAPISAPGLLVAELATLHLDLLADLTVTETTVD